MKKDPAIEAIRKTRQAICEKHGHDTRALIAHYRSLEPAYLHRMVREPQAEYSTGSWEAGPTSGRNVAQPATGFAR